MNIRNSGQRGKFPSTDFKKTVTILKCFLCNQCFYAQNAFDVHMKQHQSKINRNIPTEIQRKTMTTLKNNKNKPTLESVEGKSMILLCNQSESRSKVVLPSWLGSIVGVLGRIYRRLFEGEYYFNIKNIVPNLSTIAKAQIEQQTINSTINQKIKFEKDIKQKQLIEFVIHQQKKDLKTIQNMIRRTNFTSEELNSYQQQLQYLSDLQMAVQGNNQVTSLTKKIVNKIITEIQRQNTQINNSQLIYNQYCQICCQCLLEISLESQQFIEIAQSYYHKECYSINKQ